MISFSYPGLPSDFPTKTLYVFLIFPLHIADEFV